MDSRKALLVCLAALLLVATSCGKEAPKPRDKTFLRAEEPVKVSDLTGPGLGRDSHGALCMTLFMHSTFPSATEACEAIALQQSSDHGVTWQPASAVWSSVTYGVWGYDLAVAASGRLYLTWVAAVHDTALQRPVKSVMFSQSDDGVSWAEPVRVSDTTTGQRRSPTLAVSGSHVHVAWLDGRREGTGAPGGGILEDVYFSSSTDGGATWAENACIEADLDQKLSASGTPTLFAAPDGTLYCAYVSMRRYETNVGGYWLARSTDNGRTFETRLHDPDRVLGGLSLIEEGGTLYLAVVNIKSIRSFSMQDPQTRQEVLLYVSGDRGNTWDKPVRIDDDPADLHKGGLILVSAGAGRLMACWDDDRRGVYAAASIDRGETWGKNVRLAGKSPVGITPLDLVADPSSGLFHLAFSHVRQGAGDATYLVKGAVAP